MFYDCISLKTINVGFNNWTSSNETTDWLKNVSSTGTFICPSELQEVRGTSRIPEGWTIQRKHSARSYIQDGLIAMWDGKENTAFGIHNPNATVWTDIVGGKIASPKQTGNNPIWGTNGFTGDGVNRELECTQNPFYGLTEGCTIEARFYMPNMDGNSFSYVTDITQEYQPIDLFHTYYIGYGFNNDIYIGAGISENIYDSITVTSNIPTKGITGTIRLSNTSSIKAYAINGECMNNLID
jgi:hypothetical protein